MATDLPANLAFLHDRALDPARALSAEERATIAAAREALAGADVVVVRLGGMAGRLGECIVATGLLESLLAALRLVERAGVPLHLLVDEGAAALFDARLYQERGWPLLRVSAMPPDAGLDLFEVGASEPEGEQVLVFDLHGANDEMPCIEQRAIASGRGARRITILAHLARVGLRSYAARGAERRYADFIEELFGLPPQSIAGSQAQPRILLSESDIARSPQLARSLGLDPTALLVVCFFQSVVVAKCYERWDEVMAQACQRFATAQPSLRLNFLLACGPDEQQPLGFAQSDLAEWLGDFTGVRDNARVTLAMLPSLRDLAIVLTRATLALANDTGPGHLAGALGIPTITPYLPGDLYSRRVWASSLFHHGVTPDPNPFTHQQLEAAVLWDRTDIINSIPPEDLVGPAVARILAAARSLWPQ